MIGDVEDNVRRRDDYFLELKKKLVPPPPSPIPLHRGQLVRYSAAAAIASSSDAVMLTCMAAIRVHVHPGGVIAWCQAHHINMLCGATLKVFTRIGVDIQNRTQLQSQYEVRHDDEGSNLLNSLQQPYKWEGVINRSLRLVNSHFKFLFFFFAVDILTHG